MTGGRPIRQVGRSPKRRRAWRKAAGLSSSPGAARVGESPRSCTNRTKDPCTSPLPKSRIMKGTKPPADSTCCLNRLRRSTKPSRRPVVAEHRHHHLWVGIRSARPREMIQMAAVCRSEGKPRRSPGKRRCWVERRTGLSTLVEKDLWLWCPSLAAFTVARNRGTGIAEAAPCTRIGCCGESG